MIFKETQLEGAFIIEPERLADERGFFARTWDQREFEAQGLNQRLAQCNVSYNRKKGTLRGMHYQAKPYEEAKLVRCTMGGIYDVMIDLRRESATFKQWTGIELTADNSRMHYIPEGFAHGFLVLSGSADFLYKTTNYYAPEHERCVIWNDPEIGVQWPLNGSPILAAKDQAGKLLKEAELFPCARK